MIYKATLRNVKYFNCRECEMPLMNEIAQAAGSCGCAPKPKRRKRVKATKKELRKFINDPYGQPLVAAALSAS